MKTEAIYICLYLLSFWDIQAQELIDFVTDAPNFSPFCPPDFATFGDSGIRWDEDQGSGVFYRNIADDAHGLSYQLGRDDDFLELYVGFVEGDPVYPTITGSTNIPVYQNVTGYEFEGDRVGTATDTVTVEVLEQLPGIHTDCNYLFTTILLIQPERNRAATGSQCLSLVSTENPLS